MDLGNHGEATATPAGGSSPFMYSWDAAAGSQTTAIASGLAAGTYEVTVTDVNGCETTASVTVTEPTPVTCDSKVISDFNGEDVSCNGATDGEALAEGSGGVAPYMYSWDAAAGSQTTNVATGLGAGTYSVTITDANGCECITSVTLTEPDPTSATAVVTSDYNGEDISCNGASDGSAEVTPDGGVSPYQYEWDAAAGSQTTAEAIGLAAGTYEVTVTDANGCESLATVELTEPVILACTTDSPIVGNANTNLACNGDTNGTATVTPTGGVTPYMYAWDAAAGSQTTATATDLAAGTYTVVVTDANGCETECEVTLTEPDAMIAGTCTVSDFCQVGDGEIEVELASGGVAPYQVTWSSTNGGTLDQTTQTITAAGNSVIFSGAEVGKTYAFTITDLNGCVVQ